MCVYVLYIRKHTYRCSHELPPSHELSLTRTRVTHTQTGYRHTGVCGRGPCLSFSFCRSSHELELYTLKHTYRRAHVCLWTRPVSVFFFSEVAPLTNSPALTNSPPLVN